MTTRKKKNSATSDFETVARGVTLCHLHFVDPPMTKPKKSDLPSKVCVTCGRPFVWRKKWERNWAEVKYCSDRCRKGKG